MKIKQIAKINGGQDGAIWNNYLFRFDHKGMCSVYNLDRIKEYDGSLTEPLSTFTLNKADILVPHSNAVMFGNEYYDDGDEFPLLYTNIYNNYAATDNALKGVCLVYRIQRAGLEFNSSLVQMIEIGFVENSSLWKSCDDEEDVRPYGNFTIDAEKGIYYAFTMRDKSHTTRYFSFNLPKASEGIIDKTFGIRRVVLSACDIREYFDCDYHHFLQGACFYDGKIYSLEGFTNNEKNPPALRVIDVNEKKQILFIDFVKAGYTIEPEMIDFENDVCYYSDNQGNLYTISF